MNVLNEFKRAIEIDARNSIKNFEEQKNLPDEERVAKGYAMTNLEVDFELNNLYIESARIICENNISKFKEGNSVLLSNNQYSFKMDVFVDDVNDFILKPNNWDAQFCRLNSLNYSKYNWEISTTNTDISTKMLQVTAQYLDNNPYDLNRVDKLLNGHTRNSYTNYNQSQAALNTSQNKAYLKAINCSDFCLIQGPPGTGKTRTIAEIVNFFLAHKHKVFVSAPTHTAINNCLNAIAEHSNRNGLAIKIGEKSQAKEIITDTHLLQLERIRYNNYVNWLSSNSIIASNFGVVVGATAYSLCYPVTKRLEGWEFDVAIIDEASQLSIPLALTILSKVKKVIFVGDHKQLDPIIPSGTDSEMFQESIFSRLARLYPNEINLLKTSYRLNSSLIEIPNMLSYNDELVAHDSTKIDVLNYNSKNNSDILNNDSHVMVVHNTFDSQGRSPYEAKIAAELVLDLVNNGVDLADIGLMSMYRAQVREIKKEIKALLGKSNPKIFDNLFIDTVDSMQGQERKYIIYSMSNSNPLESQRRLDFFYNPNRLNVAITRAINKCIVIANYKIFDINKEEFEDHDDYMLFKNGFETFKNYYSKVRKVERMETDDDDW